MADSIIFLGTGGDQIVIGKQLRASGGLVFQIENNQFILNPGPGFLTRAKDAEINIRDTIAILLSDNKTKNANDVNAAVEALTLSGLDVIGVVVATRRAISGDENETPMLNKRSTRFVERVIEVESGKKLSINNINIHCTKTQHKKDESVGFIFETQKYKVGYTADTEFTDEVADQYKNCDILILNCKNPSGVKEEGELGSDDAIHFLRKAKPSKAIITGFGVKMLQADPLSEARQIQREAKIDVVAAIDGLTINPASFAPRTKVRQNSLDEYNN